MNTEHYIANKIIQLRMCTLCSVILKDECCIMYMSFSSRLAIKKILPYSMKVNKIAYLSSVNSTSLRNSCTVGIINFTYNSIEFTEKFYRLLFWWSFSSLQTWKWISISESVTLSFSTRSVFFFVFMYVYWGFSVIRIIW